MRRGTSRSHGRGSPRLGCPEPLDDPRVTNTIYDDTTGVAEELTDAVIAHMGGKGKTATTLGIAASTTRRKLGARTKASIENHPDVELAEVREYEGVDPAQSQQ